MNSDLKRLHSYPFQKLSELLKESTAPENLTHIPLQIGEPQHKPPEFVASALQEHLADFGRYPVTRGLLALREEISNWLTRRFKLENAPPDPETQILPVNGTREALFSFTQCVVDRSPSPKPIVVMPNPFYQIYEGAALLAGAEPWFLPLRDELADIEAVPPEIWDRCQLLILCSPGNPTGAVIDEQTWLRALKLADEHDFVIAADECYSELYREEENPPLGLLQACAGAGRVDFSRCVVFHSLSKRSNLPGLRSGFVAGDSNLLSSYHLYRTYHGGAMSLPIQHVSSLAWQDEHHVIENRELYRQKYATVIPILRDAMPAHWPDGGFYLWLETPIDDREFARLLYEQWNVLVLPGQFLSRETTHGNPGQNRIRVALVAEPKRCQDAAERIRAFCQTIA